MRKRVRRKATMLMSFIVLAVIAVGLVLWLRVRTSDTPTNALRPVASASATSHKAIMPEANFQLIERALNSPDIKEQALTLVKELRDAFVSQGDSMLPPGRTVKLR